MHVQRIFNELRKPIDGAELEQEKLLVEMDMKCDDKLRQTAVGSPDAQSEFPTSDASPCVLYYVFGSMDSRSRSIGFRFRAPEIFIQASHRVCGMPANQTSATVITNSLVFNGLYLAKH